MCFRILQHFAVLAADSCSPGFYAVSTEDGQECLPCSMCEPGQGVTIPCSHSNDTVCNNCSEGYFSRLTPSGRQCTKCESCAPEQIETSPCTSTQNSVCGDCSKGYFLYVDNDGAACTRCSQCPTDVVAVHWIECAEAGEPLHNQCAPGKCTILYAPATGIFPSALCVGEWTGVASSTVTAVHTTSSTATMARPTRLPTNHGMFVPMASYQYPTIDLPPSPTAPKAIAIASIVFTVATLSVFIIALFCLVCPCEKYCKVCYSSTKKACRRCLRRDSKKGPHEIQANARHPISKYTWFSKAEKSESILKADHDLTIALIIGHTK